MELLQALYRIAAPSGRESDMIQFIEGCLKAIPNVRYSIDTMGNIYVIKGYAETYPCVVAHTDEVHCRPKTGYEVVSLRDEIIFGYNSELQSFAGIGADDKNGIWVALKCLERNDTIKCAFFVQEERGCIGSDKADMEFFNDCRFVLQCDRKGNSDLIVNITGTNLCSKKFIKDISYTQFGYKKSIGLLSDVAILKQKGLSVSCVNIACGYYEPHTCREYTVVSDLRKCLAFVQHIIETCSEVYAHIYEAPKRYQFSGFYNLETYNDDMFAVYRTREPVGPKPADNYLTRYHAMLERITQMFVNDLLLPLETVATCLHKEFPMMSYADFSLAYSDITDRQTKLSAIGI